MCGFCKVLLPPRWWFHPTAFLLDWSVHQVQALLWGYLHIPLITILSSRPSPAAVTQRLCAPFFVATRGFHILRQMAQFHSRPPSDGSVKTLVLRWYSWRFQFHILEERVQSNIYQVPLHIGLEVPSVRRGGGTVSTRGLWYLARLRMASRVDSRELSLSKHFVCQILSWRPPLLSRRGGRHFEIIPGFICRRGSRIYTFTKGFLAGVNGFVSEDFFSTSPHCS